MIDHSNSQEPLSVKMWERSGITLTNEDSSFKTHLFKTTTAMIDKLSKTIFFLLLLAINTAFAQTSRNVPFKIAERYFVKNTYKNGDIKGYKILPEKEFTATMGMATVLGADGRPTAIDFKKQFVIIVINDETDVMTTLVPEKLELLGKKKLLFTFETKLGEKSSMTMRPFTMVIVDKKYKNRKIELATHAVL